MRSERALPAWALTVLASAFALVSVCGGPPEVAPGDAPAERFSGARAVERVRDLLGDGRPHPTGTAANEAVRQRLVAQLEALGLRPELQRGWECARWGFCGEVVNVFAALPGPAQGEAVVLSAHYDSVPAAPGASDDMAGVAAVLEVARALLAAPPGSRRRPVWLLLTDGEEIGLLGAQRWLADERAARVGAVVNLEARGTGGPAYLFETGAANAWTIARYAEAVPDPATTSAYYTVYRLLPNDTDLSIHRAAGAEGAGLAFIDGVARYHTPRDDLEHLDPRSVQHLGDQALGLARSLAAAPDLEAAPPGEASYFDLLGIGVVRWPASLNLPLVLLGLALLAAAAALKARRSQLRPLRVGVGAATWSAGLVLAGAAAFGAEALMGAITDHPAPWWAEMGPFLALYGALVLGAAAAVASWPGRHAAPIEAWLGGWAAFGVVGLAVTVALPGFSYLFGVPLLAAGAVTWSRSQLVRVLAPLAVGALLWLPILAALPAAVGLASSLVFALPAAIVAGMLHGGLRRGREAGALAAVAAVGALVAMAGVDGATAADPQGVSLVTRHDADAKATVVYADGRPITIDWSPAPLPDALAAAMRELAPGRSPYPWLTPLQAVAPVDSLALEAPDVEVVERDGDRLRVRIRSRRGATALRLSLQTPLKHRAVRVVTSEGTVNATRTPPIRAGWAVWTFCGPSVDGLLLEIERPAGEVLHARVGDVTWDLAEPAKPLAALRDAARAVPFQFGDVLIVEGAHELR